MVLIQKVVHEESETMSLLGNPFTDVHVRVLQKLIPYTSNNVCLDEDPIRIIYSIVPACWFLVTV